MTTPIQLTSDNQRCEPKPERGTREWFRISQPSALTCNIAHAGWLRCIQEYGALATGKYDINNPKVGVFDSNLTVLAHTCATIKQ